MKYPSKFLSVLTSLLTVVALLTGAIAVPILWRGYYYGQIDSLSLVARTGYSPAVIREAFDQVMDFLVLGADFGTGQLKWSWEGMSHFADCRVLFRLDFALFALSALLLMVIVIQLLRKRIRLHRVLGRGPLFWSFLLLVLLFLGLGAWALTDFDSLFTAFHTLFFPGKDNWIFDWRTDEIILILPEDFWEKTAGIIALLAGGGAALLALIEGIVHRLRTPKNVYEQLRRMARDGF